MIPVLLRVLVLFLFCLLADYSIKSVKGQTSRLWMFLRCRPACEHSHNTCHFQSAPQQLFAWGLWRQCRVCVVCVVCSYWWGVNIQVLALQGNFPCLGMPTGFLSFKGFECMWWWGVQTPHLLSGSDEAGLVPQIFVKCMSPQTVCLTHPNPQMFWVKWLI